MRHAFPVIAGQQHLATSRQLRAAGWTRAAINTLSTVHGQQLLPRVYTDVRADPDAETWLRAGWLWAGPDAVLTGAWALARHGVPIARERGVITYLVRPTQRNRSSGRVRALRSEGPVPHRLVQGLPVASVERALADVGRLGELPLESARALAISVLQGRHVPPTALAAELDAGRANGTLGVRLGLDDYARGPWSLPEVALERLLSSRRRSYDFLANPRLSTPDGVPIGVPDGYLPKYGIAIQVHSRQFHSGVDDLGRDRWALTVERDSDYAAHGIVVLGVAPTTLRDPPDAFLDRLDAVVRTQRTRPQPSVLIEPRSNRPIGEERPEATLGHPEAVLRDKETGISDDTPRRATPDAAGPEYLPTGA